MMGEENPSENRAKTSKFADQNQVPKGNNHGNVKANTNFSKMKSSWSSNLVKGFSAADKKTKTRVLQIKANTKKLPVTSPDTSNQENHQQVVPNSRTKRSLIADLSCSMYTTQVHPQSVQNGNKTKFLGSSEDLFLEIDHLRNLLQESKDRELKSQSELSEYNKNHNKMLELERELELKRSEVDSLVKRVELLETEKESLSTQMASLASVMGKQDEILEKERLDNVSSVEMEVLELRRLNKDLQLQKRNLACTISSLESQLRSTFDKEYEDDNIEKIKAEASLLKLTNEDLCKQVEGLQMSRLNEVEELAYLKWVNSCLRDELRNSSTSNSDKTSSPNCVQKGRESICIKPFQIDEDSDSSATKKFKKRLIADDDLQQQKYMDNLAIRNWDDQQGLARRHSISGSNCCPEDLIVLNKRRQSDGFIFSKEMDKAIVSQNSESEINKRPNVYTNFQDICKVMASFDVEKRELRVPKPPPRPLCTSQKEETCDRNLSAVLPPPPPPPPPPALKLTSRSVAGKVQRAPQVVEFYHSLMKRESRKECVNSGPTDASEVASVRSSMIDEIENRSSHLLAIKADVETQGEFVNSLIREVNDAVYESIGDVVAFVKWLDDELCFLVDERAVLKHFDWSEKKADTLREAAFGYRDLKKLEQDISNFKDDPRSPCDIALKKMAALSDRMERSVYNILRTRDSLMRHYKEFNIPTDWMLDVGILSKIKFGSVKLAKMYMKRVAMELQCKGTSDKDSSLDYMLLRGVRFAFRIHQFAGGFDAETMHAFEELRDLAVVLNKN